MMTFAPSTSLHNNAFTKVAEGAVVAFMPAAILGWIVFGSGIAKPLAPREAWHFFLVDVLLLAPLFETALMFPVLGLLRKLGLANTHAAVASALFWAGLHAIKFPAQGLMVAWPFYVFSQSILRWDPINRNKAFLMTSAMHSLFNLGISSLEVLFWF